jgi:hypothetical protein
MHAFMLLCVRAEFDTACVQVKANWSYLCVQKVATGV